MRRTERLNDTEESLRLALEAERAGIWTALPAIVVAANLAAQTVSAQPTIQGTITGPDGVARNVNLPLLVDVPIVWPRAGGFALTFPVAAGDEVLIVFASRCIDSWWQSGGIGAPAEARMHDLSDGFAILAPTSQPKRLGGVSSSNVQLRDSAGSTFVEITPSGAVNIVAATSINLTAPSIKFHGEVQQDGGALVSNGITYGTHKHTGVQAGGDTSGGPTN